METLSTAFPEEAGDCLAAIALGVRAFAQAAPGGGPFKLVGAVNRLKGVGAPRGPGVWDLTFKPRRLIPDDTEGAVGAGGELTIRVDLADAAASPRIVQGD